MLSRLMPQIGFAYLWTSYKPLQTNKQTSKQQKLKSIFPAFSFFFWKTTFPFENSINTSGALHSFQRYAAGWFVLSMLGKLPQLLCGFSLSQLLLSPHVIPVWIHDAGIGGVGALWGRTICCGTTSSSRSSTSRSLWLWLYVWGCRAAAE